MSGHSSSATQLQSKTRTKLPTACTPFHPETTFLHLPSNLPLRSTPSIAAVYQYSTEYSTLPLHQSVCTAPQVQEIPLWCSTYILIHIHCHLCLCHRPKRNETGETSRAPRLSAQTNKLYVAALPCPALP